MRHPVATFGPPLLSWTLFLTWLAALMALSSVPGSQIGALPFAHADKVAHFGLFALGALLLARALRLSLSSGPLTRHGLAVVILAVAAGLDEIRQLHTLGRSGGDGFDLLADLVGVAAGLGVAFLLHDRPFLPNFRTPRPDRTA